ncbi:MAG: GAF domain-containing protein [Planctomycetaceae bacterium]|nr:GAF domain-containing protein [Planctomycetaceae bacterium]
MKADTFPPEWSDLLELMTDRFGRLSDHVLDNLEALLDQGRRVMNCAEAALMVPEPDGDHLKFLVSVNSRPGIAEIVKQCRVPIDRSIAGCVFTTGQMIAVANPEDFYPEVDQKTGLSTNIYLATPVLDREEILGVATFVNRPDGQPAEPFGPAEIAWSSRLTDLAAAGLRYYSRVCVQERLLAADVLAAAERFADMDSEHGSTPQFEDRDLLDSAPLARAMLALERLSDNDQDLAADLLAVLSSRGGARGVRSEI